MQKSRAEIEKEDGNKLFKSGNFHGAVKCYTRCIALDSRNHIMFSNRYDILFRLPAQNHSALQCNGLFKTEGIHQSRG